MNLLWTDRLRRRYEEAKRAARTLVADVAPVDPHHAWQLEKLQRRVAELERWIFPESVPVGPFRFRSGFLANGQDPALDDSDWPLIAEGHRWGHPGEEAWFRTRVVVPEAWRGRPLSLLLSFGRTEHGVTGGAEALLYVNGRPLQGLDRYHVEVPLPRELAAASELHLAVHAFSGMRQGDHRIGPLRLALKSLAVEALYWDMCTTLEAAAILPPGDPRRVAMLEALNRAALLLDWRQPGSQAFYDSVMAAQAELAAGLAPLRGEPGRPRVVAVGHSHIDVAWLWPLRVTRQKAARTFSTVLHLMEQYPEFRFVQSQPQLYQFIKEDQPELYERIRQRVAEGRWEPTGAMWVEADCNIPSGESLVRQILFGTRFFREEFGVDNHVLWLPDVFGYSWALPQIIAGAGLRAFMTTKISWNQFNRFPYDTFRWRGLDGTEVLTHFITTPTEGGSESYTYNGEITAESVQGLWQNYAQKAQNRELLLAYGYGDGGGGPTREMLETARRLADMPGVPRVETGSVEEYFRSLTERLKDRADLPVWDGELYLELHRGTYTSQAEVKKNNRRAEILYHNAELFAAAAWVVTPRYSYPQAELRRGWETLLRNQFHDILPGSSIPEVYQDSRREFQEVFALGERVLDDSLQALTEAMDRPEPMLVVFNGLSWERSEPVAVPWQPEFERLRPVGPDGQPLPVQVVEEDGERRLWVYCPNVPPCGWAAYPLRPVGGEASDHGLPPVMVTPERLENAFFVVERNASGQIRRIFDKIAGREVLPAGTCANRLQVFEDKPLEWDAWDIDIFYQEKGWEVTDLQEAVVEEAGPERGVLRLCWRYQRSTITQRLTIHRRIPRLDFVTQVDWQERQSLLKVAFPVDERSTRATYEIQFGNVDRPTHWNTPWDWAQFETCAHTWVDLSEGGYGVSLLNDCKYGHDVRDGTLRLTLLKSAIFPDPTADLGEHRFTYSLYPHAGDWYEGGTVPAAHALNNPLMPRVVGPGAGRLPLRYSLVRTNAGHVVVDTVKQAEDGDGLIVRTYEFGRRRGPVVLEFGFGVAGARTCNLVEADQGPAAVTANRLEFATRPFAIHTFRVRPAT